MLRGDFQLPRLKAPPHIEGPHEDTEERGPYLAFLFSVQDGEPSTSELLVLQESPPLDALGEPQAVEPFAIVHPRLFTAWEHVRGFLWLWAGAVLLVVAAVLVGARRRARWPHLFGALVALAVAGWQTHLVLRSIAFVSWNWDPGFHGAKLAILAVVVAVDLAAALALLKARSELARREQGERVTAPPDATHAPHSTPWTAVGLPLLALAAILYLGSLPWLATSGL